jgi:peptidoglycan/LPS O-acetylase OafA/YrhL
VGFGHEQLPETIEQPLAERDGPVVPIETKRLHYLDALRGLAAMSVLVYHYTLDLANQNALHGADAGFAQFIGDTLNLGKYGVVLFFLISGYIIPNSLGPTGDRIGRFCISRFFRLYPLYWLAIAAGVFLPWPDLDQSFSVATIIANITMLQGYMGEPDVVGTAWTLQIELTFYGCCVLLAAMHRMTSPRACALISAGFLAAAFALAVARNLLVMKLPLALPLALSLMFFGTLWRQATLEGVGYAKDLIPWLLSGIVVMIFLISIVGYNHDFGYHERWQPYVTCYLLAILTFVLCTTRVLLTWRPLIWLGEISYSVYLLHRIVASAAYRVGFTAKAIPLDPLVYVVALAVLVILCAWATYRLVEQPFVSVGRRLIQSLRLPGPRGPPIERIA